MTQDMARPEATRSQMRIAVTAATFGNVVEWFDFVSYGLLASYIADQFFTGADKEGGVLPLLLAFATFGVGFLARPVGGLVIGLYGDRRGRKPALVLSITLMGASTGVVAFIPGYSTIGYAAPVLLVLARLLQGFAAGGEWGGAASFLVEWAPRNRRGIYGSVHPATIFVGTLLGSFLIAGLTSALGDDFMSDGGFRIPFLVGGVIALVALPFRLKAEETPVFREEKADVDEDDAKPTMTRSALTRKLVHIFFLVGMQSAAVYTFTSYFPSFEKKYVRVDGELIGSGGSLWSNAIASVVVIAVTLASGAVSDRIGRRPGMRFSCVAVLVLTYPLIVLVQHVNNYPLVVLIQCILGASVAIFLGCLPVMLVEQFPAAIRVAGLSSSYNLASAVFGGFAPLLATALIAATNMPSSASLWVVFAALLSTIAAITVKETRGVELV